MLRLQTVTIKRLKERRGKKIEKKISNLNKYNMPEIMGKCKFG